MQGGETMRKVHDNRDEETDAVWEGAAEMIKKAFEVLVAGVAEDDADKPEDRFAKAIEDIRRARDLALAELDRKTPKSKSK
jgi:hypothetical protein